MLPNLSCQFVAILFAHAKEKPHSPPPIPVLD